MASRLIDKLLVNPNLPDGLLDENLQGGLRSTLLNTPVLTADNICHYIKDSVVPKYAKRDGTMMAHEIEFPPVAPAFERVFIQAYSAAGRDVELGILCLRTPSEKEGAKWFITCAVFWGFPHPYLGSLAFRLKPDGTLDGNYGCKLDYEHALRYSDDKEFQDFLGGTLNGAAWIVLWTLAFMNCKNATLEAVEPNAAENKRRAKHGKLPLMRYHVLKIKPFGNRSDNEAQGGTHGSPALHIRRGHFKTYTDAAPLFGQFVGTYWWEQSIAGKKSNRVVVKDYEMDLTGAKN